MARVLLEEGAVPEADLSDFTVVVLTFNRRDEIAKTVRSLHEIAARGARLLVVDNGADAELPSLLEPLDEVQALRILPMSENRGVAGRNAGLRAVETDYVVTLDDDVRGLLPEHLIQIRNEFECDRRLGGVCFKVVSEQDPQRVINWCHHRKLEEHADSSFVTCEISEGAAAFRMAALARTRLYPEDYFISHEGPALAMQLLNRNYYVRYCPQVVVTHAVAQEGRPGWRRYYYDTRNVIWLAVGYLPPGPGLRTVVLGVGAMCVYALRDGFFRYWLRGVIDGGRGLPEQWRRRERPTRWARAQLQQAQSRRPGFFYLVKRRLFRKGVQI